MIRYYSFLLALLLFSCAKEEELSPIPDGVLLQITHQGKVHESLDYENGKLFRVNSYGSCDTPFGITEYSYSNDLIKNIKRSSRGVYSSSSGAMCDPNGKYETYDSHFEYDSKGRVGKVTFSKTYVTFEYNNEEVIEKYFENGSNVRTHYLKYDEKGNLVEERTPDPVNGGIVRYEYDNQANPMRNPFDRVGSAFESPNNVVRAKDASNQIIFELKYTYDTNGRVKIRTEANGDTYDYHYQGQ